MVSVNEVDTMKVYSHRERILILLFQGLDCVPKSTQNTVSLSCRVQCLRVWGFWRHVIPTKPIVCGDYTSTYGGVALSLFPVLPTGLTTPVGRNVQRGVSDLARWSSRRNIRGL